MNKNRRKQKRKKTRTRHSTQPQRTGSAKVRADSNKRLPQRSTAFRRIARIATKTSVRAWTLFLAVAVVLGFLLDVDDAISRRLRSKPPAAEIMYFQKEGTNYRLINPASVVLQPTQSELEKNYIAIPINLAVHNQEKTRLEATRVEITYPKGLRVIPKGRPKIDPLNNALVYEHDLRSLEPVTSFTPLDTIDVIYIQYSVEGLRTTLTLRDDIIAESSTTALEMSDQPFGVDLGVKVFARDRPAVEAKVHLSLDTSQAFQGVGGPETTLNPVPLRESDVTLFHAVSKRLQAADRLWKVKVKGKPTTLALAKTRYGRGSYSGLLLDGKVTELFVDSDGDGMLDYWLEDSTRPESPDLKLVPTQPEPLTDMRRPNEVQLT